MQVLEKTATLLVLIGVAVPYLLVMNTGLAILGLFVKPGTRHGAAEALSCPI